jgi:peptidyl-prolyl cis-trans isomerase C
MMQSRSAEGAERESHHRKHMMSGITVNGAEIGERDIAAELQFHLASNVETAWREAATALVVRALLLDEAARIGIDEADEEADEEATISALLTREVSTPEADEETCRRWFTANRKRFRSPDVYEAAHILFPAAPEDEAARAKAKQAAEQTLALLHDAPQRFAELARERSACSSKANGGALGQQSRGDLVPEIETFIMSMDEGQICPVPIASRYGFHVLRLDRRVDGADLPYEAVAEDVARHLRTQSWQRGVSQYLRLLAGRAEIEGIELDAAATPLVQ